MADRLEIQNHQDKWFFLLLLCSYLLLIVKSQKINSITKMLSCMSRIFKQRTSEGVKLFKLSVEESIASAFDKHLQGEKSFDVTALVSWDDNIGLKLSIIKNFNMSRGNGIPKFHN